MSTRMIPQNEMRAKLARIIPRAVLCEITEHERSWELERKELEQLALTQWNSETDQEILEFVARSLRVKFP